MKHFHFKNKLYFKFLTYIEIFWLIFAPSPGTLKSRKMGTLCETSLNIPGLLDYYSGIYGSFV